MKALNVLIVEDELPAANRLKRLLFEYDHQINIVKVLDSIEESLIFLTESVPKVDLVFLDIHIADGNGFELLKRVKYKLNVIFTTAYDEYAVKAFRQHAIDYLMKPIKLEELADAIDKYKESAQFQRAGELSKFDSKYKERFLFRIAGRIYSVVISEIAYIYSEHKISYIITWAGQRIPSDYNLQDLEEMLDPRLFFRVNRQFIIHINAIANMKNYSKSRIKLSLNPGKFESIIISTDKTQSFKKWLDR